MPTKISIKLPSEIEALYPGITPSQYRLLCFIAYYGEYPSNPWKMTLFDEKFGIPKNRTTRDLVILKQSGWLESDTSVPAGRYFDVVLPVMRDFPQWVDAFETFSHYHYRSDSDSYLWKLARCLAAGDICNAGSLPYPSQGGVWKRLSPLVYREGGDSLMSLMPAKDRKKVIEKTLATAMESDSLSAELLDKTGKLIETWISAEMKRQLLDETATYRYFLTGERPEPREEHPTMWSLATAAIDMLYRANLNESFELFRQALQLVEPDENRNLFSNQLLNWFYALCLARCCRSLRSERARAAIDSMLGDSAMKFDGRYTVIRTFLSHFDDNKTTCAGAVASDIRTACERHSGVLESFMYKMVLKYFRVQDIEISALSLDSDALPGTLIIRNEISPFVQMTSAERAQAQDAFGSGSILGSMSRKEFWEMALFELSGQVRQCLEDVEETEKRIIYFVNDKWITAILEQSRCAGSDAEWGHDRLLSRKTLVESGYDSMDVIDMKVGRALATRLNDTPDINVILPMLAGTGRLFTGQHYRAPYTSLPVEMEKPMVAFSGKDGKIVVTSNVRRNSDGSIPSCTAKPQGNGYSCITVNPVQRDILRNLLEIKEFPATAALRIRDMAESLQGIIDVKSDLAGISVIPTAGGGGRLALRISPDKESAMYVLCIQAAPYEAGSLRREPGQGAEVVYDDSGSEPVIIRRDLQLEYDNYKEFREYAENVIQLEFETAGRTRIGASESLLMVLAWAFDHRDKCFVEWPEGRALRFRGVISASDIDITVNSGINWFEVEGEIGIGEDKYKLEDLLKAMKESDVKGYVRLGEKDYIRMTDTIRHHLEAIDRMMSGRRGRQRVVPVCQVGTLARVLGTEGGLNCTVDAGFTALLDRMQEAYDSTPEVPGTLNANLRGYQKEGYMWMKRLDAWGAGACLADDMGLGKTVQSLAFLLSKAQDGPSLVVAPKSVVPNWDIEAARFTPTLNVKVLNNESDRKSCITAAGPGDLILATYGVLGTEADTLASRSWNAVCLDEAHQIKNRNTRISAAAMRLKAASRIILTGTPIQNHMGELWNLFQFINPGLLGQWSDFKSRYMQVDLDVEHKEFLKNLVQPFILRRTKEEVLEELPEKMVYEQMVELSAGEMTLYEAMRRTTEDYFKSAGVKKKGKEKVQVNFFAELTKLRMAACSMSLVHDDWKDGSSKTDALKGILDELSGSEGNKVLVFSQFTSYLAQICAMLDKAGLRYLYMDGQTDLDERADLVTQFQNGDCPIFLASLKAGGLGLNLTAANYVILLDPWWNPAIENQAMDRAHRIGQKRNVTVIRLIARHTIEEKILRMHESKQSLSDELLEGTSDSWHLSMDDVLDMVSPFR